MFWYPHVTVAAIIVEEGRFLLVEETIVDRILFNQPAGHLEEHETLLAAVQREVLEETAWQFTPTALLGVYHYLAPSSGSTYVRFCFVGEHHDHNPHQALDTGILGTCWLNREEIATAADRLRSPMVLRCVDDYLAGVRYPLDCVRSGW